MRAVAGCLAVAAAVHAAPAALFVPAVRTALAPGLSGRGDPGHVALTFDDGPHPRATPAVLDVLDRYRVRATFFVLGRELARFPALGQEITGRGHEVAVHGWDHRCLLRRGPAGVYDDLVRTVEVIRRTTGAAPDGCAHRTASSPRRRCRRLAGSVSPRSCGPAGDSTGPGRPPRRR